MLGNHKVTVNIKFEVQAIIQVGLCVISTVVVAVAVYEGAAGIVESTTSQIAISIGCLVIILLLTALNMAFVYKLRKMRKARR